MKGGGEPLQQLYNRGYDFILNTYGSAENIIPSNNYQTLLVKGIVIDIDFNVTKNYKLAAEQPPFSIYAKIIGEDLDTANPALDVEKIFYSPLLPMHNLSIPEIGEEILIIREGTAPGTKGYYIGRISNTSTLNYYPARHYMDSKETGITSPEFKYGFSWDLDTLRENRLAEMPSTEIQAFSIPITFGDVVQQGRTQTYIRHSFNKNNKKGVLEQGLRFQQQNSNIILNNSVREFGGEQIQDPSIGETATKNIHFVDTSIKKLGDYNLMSVLNDNPSQGDINGDEKSIIANMADEIYDISTAGENTLYRQVLGEKLISHQLETNSLIKEMLDGMASLAQTTQILLDAFVDHTHALPRIDINLEKEIVHKDLYRTPVRVIRQPDKSIWVTRPKRERYVVRTRTQKYRTGYTTKTIRTYNVSTASEVTTYKRVPTYGYRRIPVYSYRYIPGKKIYIPTPPRIIRGRYRTRNVRQKINFEAIIGGAENPRFTAPIETDAERADGLEKTELGLKTADVDEQSTSLIDSLDTQKETLNEIVTKANDFLSRNQFIN